MKKYSNSDIKSLKRNEIIDLLKKEGVEFDETLPFFSLRKLLLDIEVEEEKSETEQPDLFNNSFPKEENENDVDLEDEKEVLENNDGENVEHQLPQPNKSETDILFKDELSKRMSAFGRKEQSAFSVELARRQGKVSGKISFAEELKLRQRKTRV